MTSCIRGRSGGLWARPDVGCLTPRAVGWAGAGAGAAQARLPTVGTQVRRMEGRLTSHRWLLINRGARDGAGREPPRGDCRFPGRGRMRR